MESTIVAQEKSTHAVEVVPVELKPHPNADSLSIVSVYDYTVCVRTADWKNGDLGAYIPPDSIVDVTRPEFAFLGEKGSRIKARRLRGVWSYGLMVPAPAGSAVGENVADKLGVTHYEPPIKAEKGCFQGRDAAEAPTGTYPKYDVDSFLKYGRRVFVPNEPVYISEKIHGASARYVYANDRMNCGSRTEWKKEFSDTDTVVGRRNMWWNAADGAVIAYCRANPGHCVYGEVYGAVQNLRYGAKGDEVFFRAFDIRLPSGAWMCAGEFIETCEKYGIPAVPVVAFGVQFDFDHVVELASGDSLIPGAGHYREGVVVKPLTERWDERLGRVSLKAINPTYLEKS